MTALAVAGNTVSPLIPPYGEGFFREIDPKQIALNLVD